MNTEELTNELLKINNYLKKCLWMDFEFAHMDGGKLVVAGRIDTSYNDFAINIEFGTPFFVSSLLSWHLDDATPFIELIEGDALGQLNEKYHIEQGNYLFKINAEGFDSAPIIIASKSLKCEIINEQPF
ncbi:hypothetical protein [Enterococcus sp. LJL51]|uniref:hypothetical protein n=1 Tax=Enterococcus sp. LJL51 TaxID=3416656 RepID=UPI003CF7DADC